MVCILGILTMNVKVFASKSTASKTSKNTTLTSLKSQLYADGENDDSGGGSGSQCKSDKCEKEILKGIPPFQYIVTYEGVYKHCGKAASGTCSSSACETQCDAGITGGH
ncbi:hypothetical protein [Sphingobacterium sp.]|uniref:hypothetical protein n=1 Tax=Sphingobacterium sp. TaxID=341027 RepID=UPI0025836396|nr:hypothetical protein [Sphingobacterium sp.]WET69017.1 MAG: hypothetical protein P0Y57_24550 [Sphingobacterium sp.]